MAPKVAIVYYSMYGHIAKLAQAEKEGIESAGGQATLLQIKETLAQEVLDKMYAPAKDANIKTIEDPSELEEYDAFLIGIPTRYGNFPAQWKTFWDRSGKQWATGGFYGKLAGVFVSSAGFGGGQESTVIAAMSTLAHHGIIYVPLGYSRNFQLMTDVSEVRGGSPWGAGTFAATDGSRQPTEKELEVGRLQGKAFYETAAKHFGA